MAEITEGGKAELKHFIRTQFAPIEVQLANDYAEIAIFLSDEQRWGPELAKLSEYLKEEYWLRTYRGHSNRLSHAISAVGTWLGFSNYANGIVMAGYTSPGVFVSYVENGAFWKDAVSANHGEYSHSLQWLMLALARKEGALPGTTAMTYLFKQSVAYRSKDKFAMPGRDPGVIYLWDFLVDCFDFGTLQPDYKTNVITHTARSPTHFNTAIQSGTTWIGQHLRDRYTKREWGAPGSSTPVPIKDYAIDRATKKGYTQEHSNSGDNYVYKHDRVNHPVDAPKRVGPLGSLRGTLKVFEGAWGQKAERTVSLEWKTKIGSPLTIDYPGDTSAFKAGHHPVTFDFAADASNRISVQNLGKL